MNANLTTINVVFDQLLIGPIFTFETLQNVLQVFNHPPDEAAKPRQMTPRKNLLQIDDLSDPRQYV